MPSWPRSFRANTTGISRVETRGTASGWQARTNAQRDWADRRPGCVVRGAPGTAALDGAGWVQMASVGSSPPNRLARHPGSTRWTRDFALPPRCMANGPSALRITPTAGSASLPALGRRGFALAGRAQDATPVLLRQDGCDAQHTSGRGTGSLSAPTSLTGLWPEDLTSRPVTPLARRTRSEKGGDAPVDIEDMSIHKARRVRGVENFAPDQFLNLAPAPGRSGLSSQAEKDGSATSAAFMRRAEMARRDGVAGPPVFRPAGRHALGQIAHRPLGRRAWRNAGTGQRRLNRG